MKVYVNKFNHSILDFKSNETFTSFVLKFEQ